MKRRTNHITAGVVLTALLTMLMSAWSLGPASADPPTQTTIRSTDLLPFGDTRANGSVTFLNDGIRLTTTDSSSAAKASEFWAAGPAFPTRVSYDWSYIQPSGSTAQPLNQPGVQIIFDTDADRTNVNSYNALVGEQVYSTNPAGTDLTDFWMNGGSTRAAQRGITCPSTTGGSGSDCHGTLAQWAIALPTAEVYALGFSLGSGVQGDGILNSVSTDTTTYEFTNVPAATEPQVGPPGPQGPKGEPGTTTVVTVPLETSSVQTREVRGYASVRLWGDRAVVRMRTWSVPRGAREGLKIVWRIRLDGKKYARIVQGPGEKDRLVIPATKDRHVLKVNGEKFVFGPNR